MSSKSIPQIIIDILSKESRLTIKEIFEKSSLPKEKKEYLRLCVNWLSTAKNPKIAKDDKIGKEYPYSLIDNIEESEDTKILKKTKKIVNDLLDGKNISEEEYAYITRDNWEKKERSLRASNSRKKSPTNRKI